MNAIEAMRVEIGYQVDDLPRLDLPLQSENCLFAGLGDSYAAALVAQHVSGGATLCCYPTDIIQNPFLARARNMYFVSNSGRTKANILAAKVAKKQGARTIAITARPTSPLAVECDQTIELKYRTVGVTTAGTISFTSSMLACASVAAKLQLPDIAKIYRVAEKQARRIAGNIEERSSYFILGNGILHPAAIYGALKFNEVFGAKALPYQEEEFCHSPLFSVKKSDQIIVLGSDGRRLNERFAKEGISSVHVNFQATRIELMLRSTFFLQLLVLTLAQRRKMTSCYFLNNRKLLGISSDFIYS